MAKVPKAERVFAELRADILAGRLAPGERLRYSDLCERYGTSMGVARESMLRLVEQGLARGESQQGFQVMPLSRDELLELTDARVEIEALTFRRAISDGDVEWEARLLAAHHRMGRAPLIDPSDPKRLNDAWMITHAEFHETLLSGCANKRLTSIASSLRDSAELYRSWSVPFGHDNNRDVAAEHGEILNAALSRDFKVAVPLLVDHIARTTSSLLASPVRRPSERDDVPPLADT